ncbi:MAG: hypothetical protein AAGB05_12770, partial [Pseudomonadota bacterium]
LFAGTGMLNLWAVSTDTSSLPVTHLCGAALAFYLLVEARLALRRTDTFGLLSPAFLALLFHFYLSYLLALTVAASEPRVLGRFGQWLPATDPAFAQTMVLVALAVFAMRRGAMIAQPMCRRLRRGVAVSPLIRRQIRPHIGLVVGIQALYLGLVALAIELGVYGMLSRPEALEEHLAVLEWLNLSLAAGTLSFFLILLRYFEIGQERRVPLPVTAFVVLLIAAHVGAGALAAFKSQVIFPFIIAGFAYFVARQRMPWHFIACAAVALTVAYAVVEPFRAHIAKNGPPETLVAAVGAVGEAYRTREDLAHQSDVGRGEAFARRVDLLGVTSVAVAYVDAGKLTTAERHAFQDSLLLAPILAYVPRAIWPSKPSYSRAGLWFNQTVLGRWHDTRTSVGMGPIGYLYMMGGVGMVALGFFGFGVLQALLFDGVARAGAGGLIIYLSVARTLVTIPTSFGPAITGVLRMLPIAVVAQWLLLRRSR